MNQIFKTILSLFFLALAPVTSNIQAQPVRNVWIDADRTNLRNVSAPHIHHYSKKGSLLSARRLYSKKATKKQALKYSKKSRAPANDFKPYAPRLEAPVPAPGFDNTSLSPHSLPLSSMDSKSSGVPTDTPSSTPTISSIKTPKDVPNDVGEEVTVPDNSTTAVNRPFDISPIDRMLPKDAPPTEMPTIRTTNNKPTSVESSDAPTAVDDSLMEAETKADVETASNDTMIFKTRGINPASFAFLVVYFSMGIGVIANYLEAKRGCHRSQEEDEGQFVNN